MNLKEKKERRGTQEKAKLKICLLFSWCMELEVKKLGFPRARQVTLKGVFARVDECIKAGAFLRIRQFFVSFSSVVVGSSSSSVFRQSSSSLPKMSSSSSSSVFSSLSSIAKWLCQKRSSSESITASDYLPDY